MTLNSSPVAKTLQDLIDQCPATGFVVLGDTAKGGTVTSFARVGEEVFAREQSYGRGRAPHEVYDEGQTPLLEVLLKACDGLGNETTFTWQAWDYFIPNNECPDSHPSKVYIGCVFAGKDGAVAPPAKRMR